MRVITSECMHLMISISVLTKDTNQSFTCVVSVIVSASLFFVLCLLCTSARKILVDTWCSCLLLIYWSRGMSYRSEMTLKPLRTCSQAHHIIEQRIMPCKGLLCRLAAVTKAPSSFKLQRNLWGLMRLTREHRKLIGSP